MEAIKVANPRQIMSERIKIAGKSLRVSTGNSGCIELNLHDFNRIFVIGGGKASAYMAQGMQELLGNRITAGWVNIPDYLKPRPKLDKITLHPASHPVPDQAGVKGVQEMLQLGGRWKERDLVICLISGGGSSLMPLPARGITLEDKKKVTALLLKCGAEIHEINSVRKHLSGIKGGRLAQQLAPATVLALIISDVVGDELGSIASGPTAPDPTSFKDSEEILQRYAIWNKIPLRAKKLIELGTAGKVEETPKPSSKLFDKVHNILIGSNKLSCEAAANKMKKEGFHTILLTTKMTGEARQVGTILAAIASDIQKNHFPLTPPAAVVAGGETTVVLKGRGIGGRNQEVALAAALRIAGLDNVVLASAGTDGVDGPTKAAGAIVDGSTVEKGKKKKLDAKKFLDDNDSYHYFQKIHGLIVTGATGTNVNDVMVLAVGRN